MMGVMDVRLLVAHPSAETKQIRLGAETLVGRGPECKLRISSAQVSRRHCLIKVAAESVSVRDLGSANGTRLNGQAISTETDVPILPGSTLVVGPLKFVVQFAAPRTIADDDTEWLSALAVAAKSASQQNQSESKGQAADGEETKDYPPSLQRRRSAPPPVVVARGDSSMNAGASPARDIPAESDRGQTTEVDIAIDPGETIFDVSLEESADPSKPGAVKPGQKSDAEKASETHLLFEEDDLPSDDPDEQLRKFLSDA
jgi:predicted component of type VI protein secretion system